MQKAIRESARTCSKINTDQPAYICTELIQSLPQFIAALLNKSERLILHDDIVVRADFIGGFARLPVDKNTALCNGPRRFRPGSKKLMRQIFIQPHQDSLSRTNSVKSDRKEQSYGSSFRIFRQIFLC